MNRLTAADEPIEKLEVNQPVRRILCAVGPGDASVLRMAADLSKRWSAELYVLHVVPEIHEGQLNGGFEMAPLSESTGRAFLETLTLEASDQASPVQAKTIVRTGQVKQAIEQEAIAVKADLLITGRKHAASETTKRKKPLLRWDWVLSALGFDPVSAGW